ncbi:MAG: cation:proton antiporter [Ruminococcaceae bacterium]|nr:cation:proton antiporter [Oscillospiraceae bacterium]
MLGITNPAAQIILSVSLMLMGGYAATRITKRLHLPNVTAYILVGILLGPMVTGIVPQTVIDGMAFLSDIAIALIAFNVGEFFRLSALRKTGGGALLITLIEATVVSVSMFAVMYFVLRIGFALSIVLAALAAATAPTSTMMTIRQTRAKGPFVDNLLQVMALDNVIGLVTYSVAISLALAFTAGQVDAGTVLLPVAKNLGAAAIGAVFGVILKLLMPPGKSTDNRLIIAVGVLFAFCGVCALLDVSPLLGCMMIGTVYINLTNDKNLFLQMGYLSPPIMLLYFVRSGLNFDFSAFTNGGSFGGSPLWLISGVFFLLRLITKYGGAFAGSAILRRPREVRNFLGMALIPQAGVAIGLSALGARALGGELGTALENVILASSILYEFVGPALAKMALSLSGSIGRADDPESEPPPKDASELIAQVKKIREENAREESERVREMTEHGIYHPPPIGEEERAFTEAAEEHMEALTSQRPGLLSGRFRR